jgi:pimeloyl-ACP methyl ester carboxylesterase
VSVAARAGGTLLALLLTATAASATEARRPQVVEARASRDDTVAAPRAGPPFAIHELYIEVGRYSIRALCTGGRREVLLLHGDGASADTWRPVLERLDPSVGACAYDRPGSGESVPAPDVRGWYELADEMRRIHLALGFDGGYVLVGQALGGLYARLFAADRPTDVAALLLVEPAHEDMPNRVRTGMPAAAWEDWMAGRETPNGDGVREVDLAARARGRRLPDLPVTVITASRRPDGDGWDARFLNEAARQVHASILRGVERARHVPAEGSGPDVQLDQPWIVTQEILRILGASRR